MKQKGKKRKSFLLRLILLGFSIYLIVSLGSLQMEKANIQKELETHQATYREKSLKIKELTNLLENGTEKEYIERAARERLGYVYVDEQVFVDVTNQ